MRVLHYIDHVRREDLLSAYLTALTTVQEQLGVEVCVATRRDAIGQKLRSFRPHIVHVHTIWSWRAAQWVRLAGKQGCGVVVSPHGALDAYRCRHERRWSKLAMTVLYQRRMVSRADALLASTDHEAARIARLGWNDQADTIGCALLDSRLSVETMGRCSVDLYHKVIDTRYAHYLTPEDNEVIGSLLHAAIDREPSAQISSERLGHLHALDADHWRRLCLWAEDEDVMALVAEAVRRLELNAPLADNNPTTISRYPVRHPKRRDALPADDLLLAGETAKEKWRTVLQDESDALKRVVTLLLNARTLSRRKEFSLRHLCDLYAAIKFLDYDEEELKAILPRFSAVGFSRRAVAVLGRRLLLTEGFMPLRTARRAKDL